MAGSSPPLASYKPVPIWSTYWAVGGVIAFVVIVTLISGGVEAQIPVLVVGAAGLLSLGLIYWINTLSRLEIRVEGIRYTALGFCVASGWSNIAGYSTRVMGFHDIDSLILKTPCMELAPLLDFGRKITPLISVLSVMMGRGMIIDRTGAYQDIIPVGLFDEHWRVGEIGALIRRFAPEAFEKEIK